jgi:uncharacterized protein YdaU (DUF1376 family)
VPIELPYFRFYPQDFIGDPDVISMCPLEVGAYIKLLCIAWLQGPRGSVTDQLATLKRYTGLSNDEWETHKNAILAPFEHRDGRYFQKRMVHEAELLSSKKHAQSEGGKAGNANRWLRDRSAIGKRSGKRSLRDRKSEIRNQNKKGEVGEAKKAAPSSPPSRSDFATTEEWLEALANTPPPPPNGKKLTVVL